MRQKTFYRPSLEIGWRLFFAVASIIVALIIIAVVEAVSEWFRWAAIALYLLSALILAVPLAFHRWFHLFYEGDPLSEIDEGTGLWIGFGIGSMGHVPSSGVRVGHRVDVV